MTVNKELIENIKWLKKSVSEISVYDLNYYTAIELYYNIAKKLNEVINELLRFEGVLSEEIIKQNEKLVYLLGEGLTIEVVKKINQMVEDGTIDKIINHNIFSSINKQLSDISINVTMYGVKGDGVTDNTGKINEIMLLNPTSLYFPKGNYVFQSVDLISNLEIYGTIGTKFLVQDTELFIGENKNNISIKNIEIEGTNGLCNANERTLFFNKCNNIKLENIKVTRTKRHGFVIIDSDNIKINNINMEDIFGTGILISAQTKDCDNVKVENCNFFNIAQEQPHYGVYFNSGDVFIVKNSYMTNITVDTTYYGGLFPGGDNNTITNCNVKNCSEWRGIWIHDSRNIKVIGGNYSYCGREGIYVQKAHDVDIINTTCEFNRNSGIKIDSDYTLKGRLQGGKTNKNVKVIGATCINNSQGTNKGVYSGININSIDNVNGMKYVQIIGCRIFDNQNSPTQKRSIDSSGHGEGHIITSNYCDGSIQEGIVVTDSQIIEANFPITNNFPKIGGSEWNKPHLVMGNYEIWVDNTTAKPRIKNGKPTSQTDGSFLSSPPVGSSSNRPIDCPSGTQYFDSTLNKPIWRNSANTNWIDASGTVV